MTVEKGTSLDGFRAKPNAPNQCSRDLRSPDWGPVFGLTPELFEAVRWLLALSDPLKLV